MRIFNSVKKKSLYLFSFLLISHITVAIAICPYDQMCIDNNFGAGSPYRAAGLMNPYSDYGNRFSDVSWNNPSAMNPPKVYDQNGNYVGDYTISNVDPNSLFTQSNREMLIQGEVYYIYPGDKPPLPDNLLAIYQPGY